VHCTHAPVVVSQTGALLGQELVSVAVQPTHAHAGASHAAGHVMLLPLAVVSVAPLHEHAAELEPSPAPDPELDASLPVAELRWDVLVCEPESPDAALEAWLAL
jgi:hypothetical protein